MKSRAEMLAAKGIKPVRFRVTSVYGCGLPIGMEFEGYIEPEPDHSSGTVCVYAMPDSPAYIGGRCLGEGHNCEQVEPPK